jgi:hypothetical protein
MKVTLIVLTVTNMMTTTTTIMMMSTTTKYLLQTPEHGIDLLVILVMKMSPGNLPTTRNRAMILMRIQKMVLPEQTISSAPRVR